ncbi:MAG TPA: hypothetical protein VFI38_00360 [Candidatus Acidoferrum sp.]|nr:hypothetical protein [Candidatus Acidoferrum sp.]
MNTNFLQLHKEAAVRNLIVVLGTEVLLFLLPTNGAIEGVAAGYWDGVRLRLSSGKFWMIALISGICIALILYVLMIFSAYLARFVKPPSGRNHADDSKKRSSD